MRATPPPPRVPPPSQPAPEPYRFGPVGLFMRVRRWYVTAPLWQILVLTGVLLILIGLVRLGVLSGP